MAVSNISNMGAKFLLMSKDLGGIYTEPVSASTGSTDFIYLFICIYFIYLSCFTLSAQGLSSYLFPAQHIAILR